MVVSTPPFLKLSIVGCTKIPYSLPFYRTEQECNPSLQTTAQLLVMDWFILLLLVPVMLAPIVLLCGFSGCSLLLPSPTCSSDEQCPAGFICVDGECILIDAPDVPPAPAAPTRPENLVARAVSESEIRLTWENTDPAAPDSFEVGRHGENEEDFAPIPGAPAPITVESFDDAGLPEGTTFFYEVSACNGEGCSVPSERDSSTATTFPAAPSNLIATAVDANQIDLSWTNNSARPGVRFSIEHRINATDPFTELVRVAEVNFSDAPLAEGSAHEYRIIAVLIGVQAGTATEVRSAPSAAVQARTWAVALQVPLTTDQASLEGLCFVQSIPSALLSTNPAVPSSGTQVKITVRGSTTGSLTIDRIYLSRVRPGGDLYDSLPPGVPGGLTRVLDASLGDPPLVLAAGTAQTLGPIAFDFLPTEDMLIATDISTAPGEGNARFATGIGASTLFFRLATQQAAVADRAPSATDATAFLAGPPGQHYLIEQIEVL
jgi:hypothetical protein